MSNDTICNAIATRTVISFIYGNAVRTVEPHALGYDRAGDLTLSAWQLGGGSGLGWRDFHFKKMSGITMTDSHFSAPRPGYNPNDSTMARIVCHL